MTQIAAITRPSLRTATRTAATILLGVALITLCAKLRVPYGHSDDRTPSQSWRSPSRSAPASPP